MIVVDSSGWLEVLKGGGNADSFKPLLRDTDQLIVPTICMVEVLRRLLIEGSREEDITKANGFMHTARVVSLTDEIALEVAKVGVRYRLPMADSIIYATALAYEAELWTQDQDFHGLPGVHFIAKEG